MAGWKPRAQPVHQIHCERCLAGAADRQAADADHGRAQWRRNEREMLEMLAFECATLAPEAGQGREKQAREPMACLAQGGGVEERPQTFRKLASGAASGFEKMLRAQAEFASAVAIEQESANRGKKFISGANLHKGIGVEEIACDGFEILHVRTDHDGRARGSGFEDVVSAARRDRAADKNGISEMIEPGQFADCIEQKDAWQFEMAAFAAKHGGAAAKIEFSCFEFSGDRLEAVGLARRENEQQVGELARERFKSVEHEIVLIDGVLCEAATLVGADRAGRDPDVARAETFERDGGSGCCGIVFQIGGNCQAIARRAEFGIALEIGLALDEDQVGQAQYGTEMAFPLAITAKGAL